MKNTFVHLRVHSNFSLAEGMLSFDCLSKFCRNNLQPAIAITDTSNMFGALEFSLEMVGKGIQPIIGIQVNIAESNENDGCITIFNYKSIYVNGIHNWFFRYFCWSFTWSICFNEHREN